MKLVKSIALGATLLCSSSAAFAGLYWPSTITDWKFYMANGVAYIESPQIPEHCANNRMHIPLDGTSLNEAIYGYALAAWSMGNQKLDYTINSEQTECVVYALKASDK